MQLPKLLKYSPSPDGSQVSFGFIEIGRFYQCISKIRKNES